MPVVTITYLETRSTKELRPSSRSANTLIIQEVIADQRQQSRNFYCAVGAPWAWNDKRYWSDEQWQTYAKAPELRTFIAYLQDEPVGYFELHQTNEVEIEIAYFGLLPAFVGRGLGGELLTKTLETAWQQNPSRVWVHTCDLDHPAALSNYQARGMVVYKVEVHETPAIEAEKSA